MVLCLSCRWGIERYGHTPRRVPQLQHLAARLQHLAQQLQEAQAQQAHSYVPAAFVTFDSRWMAVVAATSLHRCAAAGCL